MLKSHHVKAGLGNPPEPFYTNDVESQNNVIKHQTRYSAQELPQFISCMREMFICQREEIERAVIGMGEYRLSSRFSQLSVDSGKFFLMTGKQREKILKRFFAAEFCGEVHLSGKEGNDSDEVENQPQFELEDEEDLNPFLQCPSI